MNPLCSVQLFGSPDRDAVFSPDYRDFCEDEVPFAETILGCDSARNAPRRGSGHGNAAAVCPTESNSFGNSGKVGSNPAASTFRWRSGVSATRAQTSGGLEGASLARQSTFSFYGVRFATGLLPHP